MNNLRQIVQQESTPSLLQRVKSVLNKNSFYAYAFALSLTATLGLSCGSSELPGYSKQDGGSPVVCVDNDNDLFYAAEGCGTKVDCDDNNNMIYPGSPDICDGINNDCDPQTPDGSGEHSPLNTLQAGVCLESRQSCINGEWKDRYASVTGYEAETEVSCDNKDNNCNGQKDEDLIKSINCSQVPSVQYNQECINGVWTDIDIKNCPECLDGEIKKIECVPECPVDDSDCDSNPCKSYATEKCIDEKWVNWSDCTDRVLLAEAYSARIFNDKVAMISSRDRLNQILRAYNLSEELLEDKLMFESGDWWVHNLADFRENNILISGYYQDSFVFNLNNNEITPIIFSPDFEIDRERYHPFCDTLSGNSVFCNEDRKPNGYFQKCIVEHNIENGEEVTDYCDDLFPHAEFIGGDLIADGGKIAFSGSNGNKHRLGIFDLNTRETTIIDEKLDRCGVYHFNFQGTNLVYSYLEDPSCPVGILVKPEDVYLYKLETGETENITEKSGHQCVLMGAGIYGNNLSCLTSYFPNTNKIHLINLDTGDSVFIAGHAGDSSLFRNKLVYESRGNIHFCELKDEWAGE